MKKLLIFCLTLGNSIAVFSQQSAQFTQFMQTGTVLNPAFTGISRNGDFKFGYRKQWVGLEGAPTTFFISGSAMLGIDEPTISLPVRGRLSSQFNTVKPEVKEGIKHSIGAYLMMDKTGPTSFNRGALNYAINIPFAGGWRASLGGGMLFQQSALNRLDLDQGRGDPGIQSNVSSQIWPNLQLGGMVYNKTMFFGYSANYLFPNKLFTLSDKEKYQMFAVQKNHHYGFAGYRLDFGDSWSFIPSVMLKYVDGSPFGFETNARFNYSNRAWFGLAYRPQDAASAFVGINLNSTLNISYSYDYSLSALNAFNNGSHEVILGIRFAKKGEKIFRPLLW